MKKIIIFLLLCYLGLGIYYFFPQNTIPKLPNNVVIDKILVLKSQRQLQVFAQGKLMATFTISLGKNPIGHKEFEGDNRTPEGIYFINSKNSNSHYHKNLGVSYPNAADIEKAKQLGKSPGGDIKIHGLRNGTGFIGKFHRWHDWTAGCIALTDREIDDLYSHINVGTPIEIKP
jgi:murein L,D-transpeptidase YafK